MDKNSNEVDFIGSCECQLGTLFGSRNKTLILEIKNNNKAQGKLILKCELEC